MCEKNVQQIVDEVKMINLQFLLDKKVDVNIKWNNFKNKVNDVIDRISPLKEFIVKDTDHDPWYDKELFEAEKLRDYLHYVYNSSFLESALLNFKHARDDFQKLRRVKQKEFFESKNMKDFKNSKQYWQFNSRSIKIKSDKNDIDVPTSFKDGSNTIDDPVEEGNMFNFFFTNLSSESTISYVDSSAFVADVFRALKNQNKIVSSTFSFVPTRPVRIKIKKIKFD
jgi:hypothetical protein